jgi:hypothetical protein
MINCGLVIQCQRIVRGYIQIRHAQLQLLILQWDCYAPIWWQKRITPTSVPDGEDGKKYVLVLMLILIISYEKNTIGLSVNSV